MRDLGALARGERREDAGQRRCCPGLSTGFPIQVLSNPGTRAGRRGRSEKFPAISRKSGKPTLRTVHPTTAWRAIARNERAGGGLSVSGNFAVVTSEARGANGTIPSCCSDMPRLLSSDQDGRTDRGRLTAKRQRLRPGDRAVDLRLRSGPGAGRTFLIVAGLRPDLRLV